MKKLIILVILACAVYYFFLANDKATDTQLQPEDRVFDYDIQYNEAVDKIDEAVKLNLDNKKTLDKITDGVNAIENSTPAEKAQNVLDEIEKAKPEPE